MLRNTALAAAMLVAWVGTAHAQQPAPPPAPPPPPERNAPPPPPPPHGGPKGPMEMGKSFDLRLDRGQGLRVNCGDEPLKACIDASMPLLDKLRDAPPPPPPPPGSMPPAPPRP